MSALLPLTEICPRCSTGHLPNPCPGGYRCTCACRKCGFPWKHASTDPDVLAKRESAQDNGKQVNQGEKK